jgi:uncharacterized protein YjbI with pentapeptide repeats
MSMKRIWRWCAGGLGGAVALALAPSMAMAAQTTFVTVSRIVDGCTIVANPTSTNHTDCPGSDLKGANFAYTDLAFADLSGAELRGASFPGSDLSGADLSAADLSEVSSGGIIGFPAALPTDWTITNGYLLGPMADLSYANLSGTNLTRANFAHANLTGADLYDTILVRVNLRTADLTDIYSGAIDGPPGPLPAGWQFALNAELVGPTANLTGSSLVGGDLEHTDLSGVNLTDSTLERSDLTGDHFTGANFTDSTLTDDNLSGDNFSGANLTGVTITGSNLAHAQFRGTTLTGTTWSDTTCPDGTNSDNDGDTCVNNLG